MTKIGKPFKNFVNLPYPKGSIFQDYGGNYTYYSQICPLEGQCLKGHNGIDMAVSHGQEIWAVEGGIVIDAVDNPTGYGKYVRVQSGDREWVYGHLSKTKVIKKQFVKQGDVIGLAGNTGLVFPRPTIWNPYAGTHLHLGLRITKGGVVQDYNNGYFGSIDFKDMLPDPDPINDDIEGFVGLLRTLLEKLKRAGIELKKIQ